MPSKGLRVPRWERLVCWVPSGQASSAVPTRASARDILPPPAPTPRGAAATWPVDLDLIRWLPGLSVSCLSSGHSCVQSSCRVPKLRPACPLGPPWTSSNHPFFYPSPRVGSRGRWMEVSSRSWDSLDSGRKTHRRGQGHGAGGTQAPRTHPPPPPGRPGVPG